MCLSVAESRPQAVLGRGTHAGFEWNIVHNEMGYRCGYVKVPPGHPWYGKDYDDIDADVHGGLTFAEPDTPCDKGGPDNGWWVGFDCAHLHDAPDPELPNPSGHLMLGRGGVVRDQAYVIEQCKSLCEQAEKTKGQTDG